MIQFLIMLFIPCHRKCSQLECRKATVYLAIFTPKLPIVCCVNSVEIATELSMAWYKIITQHFFVVYHGASHISLNFVFSWYMYTHFPKGLCVYQENTSDLCTIPWYMYMCMYTTQRHVRTSIIHVCIVVLVYFICLESVV